MNNDSQLPLYESLTPGTPVIATGCTYATPGRLTLNAGPPARVLGDNWRSLGAVDLDVPAHLESFPATSNDSIEVTGIWTGRSIIVDGWREAPFVAGKDPVGARIPHETTTAIARSLDEEAASGMPSLGQLTDCDDTRNLVTVPVLTDHWRRWADRWRGTAFVQVQGFVTPLGGQLRYPEDAPRRSPQTST